MTFRIITGPPVVALVAHMSLVEAGIEAMIGWVRSVRPECLPEDDLAEFGARALFPHDCTEGGDETDPDFRDLSANELLVELAGRKCYNSFGAKAGKKTNAEYIANTQGGDIPHASIMYHAKQTFFIAGVSRRVLHELIRNYVGADRDEEGSPSQESTRYVEHSGHYIAHPWILDDADELRRFEEAMSGNYREYLEYIASQERAFVKRTGESPKGMDRKRIYESASAYLSHACETSWLWTTNPIALAKLVRERADEAADLEFQRLARLLGSVAVAGAPNLYPQPWMKKYRKPLVADEMREALLARDANTVARIVDRLRHREEYTYTECFEYANGLDPSLDLATFDGMLYEAS